VVDVLAREAPKGKPGRKKAGEEIGAVRHQLDRHGKNTHGVLQAKLAQRHPDVWADYLAGKFKSVRAAAESAGLGREAPGEGDEHAGDGGRGEGERHHSEARP
jgi:hypothetical protein